MPNAPRRRQPKAVRTIGRGKSKVSIFEERNVFEDAQRDITRSYIRFVVTHRVGKKQTKKRFADLDRAVEEAQATHASLQNSQTNAAEFTDEQRHAFSQAIESLKDLPPESRPTLIEAVKEYVQIRTELPAGLAITDIVSQHVKLLNKLPVGTTIPDAVEDFLSRRKQIDHDVSVPTAIEKFVASRHALNRSEDHVRDIEARLKGFGAALPMAISNVTSVMIQKYLDDRKVGARSKKNEYAHIRSLFRWAVKHQHAPKEILEDVARIDLPEPEPGATLVFTPSELAEMLEATDRYRPDLIPALVICGFCGLRSAEIRRLDWREVKLNRGLIEVTAGKAKTKSRRLVPICKSGRQWLAPYVQTEGPVCPVRGENRLYEAIISATNQQRRERQIKDRFQWKRNALRHSFCSYRLAETQNMNQVSLEAGNSPAMIDRHYRELVDPEEAAQWFNVRPPTKPGIIPIPIATAA